MNKEQALIESITSANTSWREGAIDFLNEFLAKGGIGNIRVPQRHRFIPERFEKFLQQKAEELNKHRFKYLEPVCCIECICTTLGRHRDEFTATLVYLVSGEGTISCSDGKIPIKAGGWASIDTKELHSYEPKDHNTIQNFLIFVWD